MNQKEIWKDIPNYEGLYQVSNLGRVKSLDRFVNSKHNYQRIKGKILKLRVSNQGYIQAFLSKDGHVKGFLVHRLVGFCFFDKREYNQCINHIDSDRTNNNLNNLEWVTYSENRAHGVKDGNVFSRRVVMMDLNGRKIREFYSIAEAVSKGFSRACISDIINGKKKTDIHKGYKWVSLENFRVRIK